MINHLVILNIQLWDVYKLHSTLKSLVNLKYKKFDLKFLVSKLDFHSLSGVFET